MNIQIDHTSFNNLGAELMHDAIIKAVKSRYPDARFIAGKTLRKSPREKLKKSGILPYNINNPLKRFIAKQLNKTKFEPWNYGLLLNDDIDVVFDAGGFRFGDKISLDTRKNTKLERYYSKLKKKGTKIIFLPQAFGPFENSTSIEAISIVYRYADLVYAREDESFANLNTIFPNSEKIKIASDFTIDFSETEENDSIYDKICIIPNKRMVTHVDKETTKNYLNTLCKLISMLNEKDFDVFLMSFCDVDDLRICYLIKEKSGIDIPIYSGLNGNQAKAIINSCYTIFSSRYHGLISALNQNVPCMTSSWSHKYEELLKEYNMEPYMCKKTESESIEIFNMLLDPQKNSAIRKSLKEINQMKIINVNAMWCCIIKQLDTNYCCK